MNLQTLLLQNSRHTRYPAKTQSQSVLNSPFMFPDIFTLKNLEASLEYQQHIL